MYKKINRKLRFYFFVGIERILFIPTCFTLRRWLLNRAGIKLSSSVNIRRGVKFITPNVIVDEGSFINTGCKFISSEGSHIKIGKNVDIAPECCFITGSHEIGSENRRAGTGFVDNIEIGDGTWIGANSTILAGVIIGKGCIVAAGSVVTKSCKDNELIAGVPATFKKHLK